jgi:hypothetical protein
MKCYKLFLNLIFAASLVACSSGSHLAVDEVRTAQTKLLGKWQAKGQKFNPLSSFTVYTDKQFEFFADGSVAESWLAVGSTVKSLKSPKGWQQVRAGTFNLADATHIKMDFGWQYAITIYDLTWKDDDHVTLRASESEVINLHRVN